MIIALILNVWFNICFFQQKDVSITLEIPHCIDLETNNEMTFVVSNNTDDNIYVYPSYLVISKVLTNEGEELAPQRRIRHHITDKISKCISISAFTSKRITVNVNYFMVYDIPLGEIAQVEGMYQTSYLNKNQRQGLEDLYTNPAVFRI